MLFSVQGYYAILDVKGTAVDSAWALAHARRLLAARPCCLQVRAKQLPTRDFCLVAREVRRVCAEQEIALCINDRLDVAIAVGADAIHLGQSDLPLADAVRLRGILGAGRLAIGISTRDLEEALAASAGGADYIGFAPIFPTQSKLDAGAATGLAALHQVAEQLKLPIVAIGGITLDNVAAVAQAGARAAAVIAAVDNAADPTAAGRRIAAAFAAT
jgi:thiamine-phosphate pyrophosphorylase